MSDVHAPAVPVRRRHYVLRDLAGGRGRAVCSALSAHDSAADYRVVMSPAEFEPDWPAALLFFVGQDVHQGRTTLFAEIGRFRAQLGQLPAALLTDSDDEAFLKSCYAEGISQVLQTSLPVSSIILSLEMIAHGHAFVPVRLLISARPI